MSRKIRTLKLVNFELDMNKAVWVAVVNLPQKDSKWKFDRRFISNELDTFLGVMYLLRS